MGFKLTGKYDRECNQRITKEFDKTVISTQEEFEMKSKASERFPKELGLFGIMKMLAEPIDIPHEVINS